MEFEPGFQRALVIVIAIGLAVFGTGAAVLYFAFRALRGERRNERQTHLLLIALLVAFVFACCMALFLVTIMSGR